MPTRRRQRVSGGNNPKMGKQSCRVRAQICDREAAMDDDLDVARSFSPCVASSLIINAKRGEKKARERA